MRRYAVFLVYESTNSTGDQGECDTDLGHQNVNL